MRLGAVTFLLAVALSGCGNNDPKIPPELRDLIDQGGGISTGTTVENLCFAGWRNPSASGFDAGAFDSEPVCFDDFFNDPEASLLLVNTAAIWCEACEVEWGGTGSQPRLEDEVRRRAPDGLRLLGTLFQDVDREPADAQNLSLWAETFEIGLPFALDPEFQMGRFADPLLQPYNMVVDTRTREIVVETNGNQPAILFSAIDQALAERN